MAGSPSKNEMSNLRYRDAVHDTLRDFGQLIARQAGDIKVLQTAVRAAQTHAKPDGTVDAKDLYNRIRMVEVHLQELDLKTEREKVSAAAHQAKFSADVARGLADLRADVTQNQINDEMEMRNDISLMKAEVARCVTADEVEAALQAMEARHTAARNELAASLGSQIESVKREISCVSHEVVSVREDLSSAVVLLRSVQEETATNASKLEAALSERARSVDVAAALRQLPSKEEIRTGVGLRMEWDLSDVRKENNDLRVRLDELERSLGQLGGRTVGAAARLGSAGNAIGSLHVPGVEGRLVTDIELDSAINRTLADVQTLVDQMAASHARLLKKKADVDAVNTSLHSVATDLGTLSNRISMLQSPSSPVSSRTQLDRARDDLAARLQSVSDTVAQLERAVDSKADASEVRRLYEDNANLGSQVISVSQDLQDMVSASLESVRTDIQSLKQKLGVVPEKRVIDGLQGSRFARKPPKSR